MNGTKGAPGDGGVARAAWTHTIERSGEVVGVENAQAHVRLEALPACGACGSRSSCASADAEQRVVSVVLDRVVRVGEQITVSVPESSITRAAFLGYLLPPVGLLTGAAIGDAALATDAAAVVGAAIGFSIGVGLARYLSRRFFAGGWQPTVCPSVLSSGDHS